MTTVLDYGRPAAESSWPLRFRVALTSCAPGVAVVLAAGVFSTVAMRHFQSRTGQTVLNTLPQGRFYMFWVAGGPLLLATTLLAGLGFWAARRANRGNRIAVTLLAGALLTPLWFATFLWIAYNGEICAP